MKRIIYISGCKFKVTQKQYDELIKEEKKKIENDWNNNSLID